MQTLREDRPDHTPFVTISSWADVESMAEFTSSDPTAIHHLDRDEEYLLELPEGVEIYAIRTSSGTVG